MASTVYNPTAYGAAGVKTAAGTTASDNQTQGSLNVFVKQASS